MIPAPATRPRLQRGRPRILAAAIAAAALLAGCDRDMTLVDPGPFFSYDPANAWPALCPGPPGRARTGPQAIPPPPGLEISACPNPAPPGTPDIEITFRLDVRRPRVNLGIIDDRGRIVRRLLVNFPAEVDRQVTMRWLLDGVEPGSYRAYFVAGDIETSGDLRVD